MTTRYMQRFFNPKSIAVIGASERNPSLGGTVLRNLQEAGFPGPLMVVNRRGGDTVLDLPRYSRVADLPQSPDLAIVCTPPATIPQLVDALGRKRVRAVLIVMGGLSTPAPAAIRRARGSHRLCPQPARSSPRKRQDLAGSDLGGCPRSRSADHGAELHGCGGAAQQSQCELRAHDAGRW